MIISSGKMIVRENKNRTAKFFKEVEVGDIIEVKVNLNVNTTNRVSDKLVSVFNHTKGTQRTDAPIYLNAGLEKLILERFIDYSDEFFLGLVEEAQEVAKYANELEEEAREGRELASRMVDFCHEINEFVKKYYKKDLMREANITEEQAELCLRVFDGAIYQYKMETGVNIYNEYGV